MEYMYTYMTSLATGGGSLLSDKTVKKKAAQKSDTSAGKSKELSIRDKSDVVKKVFIQDR